MVGVLGRTWRRLNFLSYENRVGHPAAPYLFGAFITLHVVAVYAIVRYFFRWTWDTHLAAGWGPIVLTYLACSLVMCFGEHFFHRYILHLETVRFLRHLCQSHRAHHKLTSITFNDREHKVHSEYPITDLAHDDQATFPSWALIPFFAFFTPFIVPMAFSFPNIPILISAYAAIATSHFLYEIIHVAHHMPYEAWWKPKLNSPGLGWMWRRMYGFHQAHHANYKCNMNIAGFFGIPLADMVFGTYVQPKTLLIDGAPGEKSIARELTPAPNWPVSWLDRVVFKRRRWMTKQPN